MEVYSEYSQTFDLIKKKKERQFPVSFGAASEIICLSSSPFLYRIK